MKIIKKFINKFFFKFGYRFSKINNSHELFKIYKYKNLKHYINTQVYFNKKKINQVWADELNLKKITLFLKKNFKKKNLTGVCHGSRNGFEQKKIMQFLPKSKIIGTDISPTALSYPDTIQHDFHKKKWISHFDFVYSNSLDQSYNPKLALTVWLEQIKKGGFIVLEHSEQSGIIGQGKMDPFGVEANFFPYVLSDWFGHKISISIIKSIKKNKSNSLIWIFFIKKLYNDN
jgi:hypothetical protein